MDRKVMVFFLSMVALCQIVSAQTLTGSLPTVGDDDALLFVPTSDGQAHFMLSWSDSNDSLGIIVTCSDGVDTLTWGISLPEQDRFLSLDVGTFDGLVCLADVALFGGASANYRINLQYGSADSLEVVAATSPDEKGAAAAGLRHLDAEMAADPRVALLLDRLTQNRTALAATFLSVEGR